MTQAVRRKDMLIMVGGLSLSLILAGGMFVSEWHIKKTGMRPFDRLQAQQAQKEAAAMSTPGQPGTVARPRGETAPAAAGQPAASAGDFSVIALFQTYDQRVASAVIRRGDGLTYRYRVGEALAPGTILVSIHPDHVVIGNSQLLSRVYLEEPGDSAELEASIPPAEEGAEMALTDAEQRRQNVLKHFDLRPVSDSHAAGYLIGEGFPEESARSAGVGPGDVLISVNGYPVGEPSSDYLAWRSFQATQKAAVVVRRGEEDIVLYYPEDVVVNQPNAPQQ